MKISKEMQTALNNQIDNEFEAKMTYLSMSAYFEDKNLKGFAHWMRMQAQEENTHAMKLYDFLLNRDGKVVFGSIPKPKNEFSSPLEVAKLALGHERKVTSLIHDLVTLAETEKDYATREFLQWFVAEQVEEEDQGQYLVDQLELAGDDGAALLMLDRELAKRQPETD